MSYIRCHAIIVTDHGYDDWIEKAHAQAVGMGACVSEISESVTNGVRSFAVFPDGSKEGWTESENGDSRRERIVAYLREQYYDDGSSPLSWVEVQFGDDNNEAKVIQSSDDDYKGRTLIQRVAEDGGGR